jgi:hypothetical protein
VVSAGLFCSRGVFGSGVDDRVGLSAGVGCVAHVERLGMGLVVIVGWACGSFGALLLRFVAVFFPNRGPGKKRGPLW